MRAGLVSTSVYLFTYKGWFFIPGTNMLADSPENWLFGISPLGFGAVGAVINFIAAYITMKLTKQVPEHIQHLVEDIRVPRGDGAATAHHYSTCCRDQAIPARPPVGNTGVGEWSTRRARSHTKKKA